MLILVKEIKMLIEDYFSMTNYIVQAIKTNYENSWEFFAEYYGLFQKNGLVEEYKILEGYNYIYLALIEKIERIREEFMKEIDNHYKKYRLFGNEPLFIKDNIEWHSDDYPYDEASIVRNEVSYKRPASVEYQQTSLQIDEPSKEEDSELVEEKDNYKDDLIPDFLK